MIRLPLFQPRQAALRLGLLAAFVCIATFPLAGCGNSSVSGNGVEAPVIDARQSTSDLQNGSDGWLPAVAVDAGTGATAEEYLAAVRAYNLPGWAYARARDEGHTETFLPFWNLNPFYQSGDFDGDGELDLALAIRHRFSGEIGILLVHGGRAPTAVLGAGQPFGNGGANFDWMTNWRVVPGGRGSAPADALEVIKLESASGLIYNARGEYRWRQMGD